MKIVDSKYYHETDDEYDIMEITFEKSAGTKILEMLGLNHEPKCHYCGADITEENLGGIFPKPTRVCYNDLPCFMEAVTPETKTTDI